MVLSLGSIYSFPDTNCLLSMHHTSQFPDFPSPNFPFQEIFFQKEVDPKPGIGKVGHGTPNLREETRCSLRLRKSSLRVCFSISP